MNSSAVHAAFFIIRLQGLREQAKRGMRLDDGRKNLGCVNLRTRFCNGAETGMEASCTTRKKDSGQSSLVLLVR